MQGINNDARMILADYGQRLANAKHGTKSGILTEAMEFFGWSRDTFYRNLQKLGFDSGRNRRKDAGTTSQCEKSLLTLAAVTKNSARANGKTLTETTDAISILSENGHEFKSPSTVNRLLRQRKLTAKQNKQATSHGEIRTLYPNHLHEVDASLCVLYYPPNSKKGMRVQKHTSFDEHYKNKPEQLKKIERYRVWRYVMVDHYSGVISTRYYECAGENQHVLYDFMLWAWAQKSGSPFHGMPTYLYWDKGSAMTSKAIRHAMKSLKIKDIAHATGVANATGAVEKANDIIEKRFEGRLFLEPVASVDELNEVAVKWQHAYNANLIPNYNAKHSRHSLPRTDAWLHIMRAENKQYLRTLPNLDYCRYIFTHEPESRIVKGNLQITFVHPQIKKSLTYRLANLDGVSVGDTVMVSPLVVGDEYKVLVIVDMPLADDIIHEVAPVEFDEVGYRVNAPVFGEEFSDHQDSQIDSNQKEMDRMAYPDLSDEEIKKAKKKKITPFNGEIDALSHIANLNTPAAITPKGEAFTVPDQFTPETRKPLSPLDLKIAVTNGLGRDLESYEFDVLAGYAAVYSEDVAAIVAELHSGLAKPLAKVVQFK